MCKIFISNSEVPLKRLISPFNYKNKFTLDINANFIFSKSTEYLGWWHKQAAKLTYPRHHIILEQCLNDFQNHVKFYCTSVNNLWWINFRKISSSFLKFLCLIGQWFLLLLSMLSAFPVWNLIVHKCSGSSVDFFSVVFGIEVCVFILFGG